MPCISRASLQHFVAEWTSSSFKTDSDSSTHNPATYTLIPNSCVQVYDSFPIISVSMFDLMRLIISNVCIHSKLGRRHSIKLSLELPGMCRFFDIPSWTTFDQSCKTYLRDMVLMMFSFFKTSHWCRLGAVTSSEWCWDARNGRGTKVGMFWGGRLHRGCHEATEKVMRYSGIAWYSRGMAVHFPQNGYKDTNHVI